MTDPERWARSRRVVIRCGTFLRPGVHVAKLHSSSSKSGAVHNFSLRNNSAVVVLARFIIVQKRKKKSVSSTLKRYLHFIELLHKVLSAKGLAAA